MKINHIALNIHDRTDVNAFFGTVLGLKQRREYELGSEYARVIFGIDSSPIPVILMGNKYMAFELFMHPCANRHALEHVCIEMHDREKVFAIAKNSGYKAIRIERENNDLLFIEDKSGNMFELKNTR